LPERKEFIFCISNFEEEWIRCGAATIRGGALVHLLVIQDIDSIMDWASSARVWA
jgi:hypothetical protein